MIIKLKKFIHNTGFAETLSHFKNYFSSEVALKAISFVSIPIMTRLLSPSDYGVINLFMSYLSIFGVIFTLNVYVAVGRYYYENSDDFKQFLGTLLSILLVITIISSTLLIIFANQIASLLKLPKHLIYFFVPLIVFSVVTSIFTQIFQPLKKSGIIAKVNIITALLTFIFSVLFILNMDNSKYLGTIYAYLLVGLISTILLLYLLRTYLSLSFSFESAKYIFNYSLPLIPYALSSLILAQFDRIMINSYNGANSVGLYSFAYNIGMLLSVFHSALNSAWIPYYYQYMKDRNYAKHDKEVGIILRLVVVAAVFLSYFGKEIGILLSGKSFHSSLDIVPIIVLSYFFFCIYYVYSRNFEFHKKTIISSLVVLVSGIANIALNMYAFPIYGYKAAAYTTLISYILMAILAWASSTFYVKSHSTSLTFVFKKTYIIVPCLSAFYFLQLVELSYILELIIKILLFIIFGYFTYRMVKSETATNNI